MIQIHFERLRSLGLTPALAREAARYHADNHLPQTRLMRLVEVHRETVRLHDGECEMSARVLPALARGTPLAVGDWVLIAGDPHGAPWVHGRVPPLTHIARRDADGRRHPVASNVDSALLVMGLDDDFNLRRLERYLALVQGSGVRPVIVLTKADVAAAEPALLAQRLAVVPERVGAGIDALAVDATSAATADLLAPYLGAGQTLVLLGSSGAGKSTLINTLLGAAVQDTGPVRAHDSRGKHTTTSRSLHRLRSGACVIDTPGLRALRPDVDEATLAAGFGDIQALAEHCRFRDCRHVDEPGCAVRAGIGADRVRNYHKLLRESRRDTLSALERREQLAVWKSRGKATRERMKIKRTQA